MAITFTKPDFMVVGPFRTGTTWLYSQLHHVKGINMPPYKEISFFYSADRSLYLEELMGQLAKGTLKEDLPPMKLDKKTKDYIWAGYNHNRQRNIRLARETGKFWWALYYQWIPRKLNILSVFLYSRLFKQAPLEITGDISPAYFALSAGTVERIKAFFPHLKIVFILRDPLEREWSDIRMNYFSGSNEDPFSAETYFQRHQPGSDYIRAITTWEKYFGRDSILYLFYDDLKHDPEKFMNSFIQFIKPGAESVTLLADKVGKGKDKQIDDELKLQLLKKNLPQYNFLAEKFGGDSYPAKWRQDALNYFQQTIEPKVN